MSPEAWNFEHNNLHNYYLNQKKDPDFVQNNFYLLRNLNIPNLFKKIVIVFLMFTWKWFYYAPNTYKFYKIQQLNINDRIKYDLLSNNEKNSFITIISYCFKYIKCDWMNDLLKNIMLPYFLYMFVCIPFIWYVVGFLFIKLFL